MPVLPPKNNTLCIHVQLLSYPVAAFCERLWNTCMTLLNWMRFDGRSWATAVLRNLKYFRSLFPPPTSKHRGLPRPCYTPGMHSLKKKTTHTHWTSNYYSVVRKAVNSRKWQFTQMEVKMHFLLYFREITAFSKDLNPSNKHDVNAGRSSLC